MSWEWKCKSGIQIKSGTTTNVYVGAKNICEKDYIWNPAACSCNNGKYFASILDDSVITCNEIIDAEAKLYDKDTKCIIITVAASIYWYLIKYRAKKKHYHFTSQKTN